MVEDTPDKKGSYITKYDPNELLNDLENEYPSEQPSIDASVIEKPKFKPTNATQ